jgi:hypothetical protein
MTEPTTAVDTAAVSRKNDPNGGVDAELVGGLVEQARAAGLQLTGEGGFRCVSPSQTTFADSSTTATMGKAWRVVSRHVEQGTTRNPSPRRRRPTNLGADDQKATRRRGRPTRNAQYVYCPGVRC